VKATGEDKAEYQSMGIPRMGSVYMGNRIPGKALLGRQNPRRGAKTILRDVRMVEKAVKKSP